MLLYHTDISPDLIDTCEGGFFSVYIDHNLNVSPCSFSNNSHDLFNLREYDFYDIWLDKLKVYRIKNKINVKEQIVLRINNAVDAVHIIQK